MERETERALREDENARRQITEDIDRNILVEASAGSGKTTSLVSRMIAMVRKGIPVSSICAITFTKAAAREFYGRFQEGLIKAGLDPEIDETQRERCNTALRNIDLCFMNTIDSFAQTILREHPVQAGLPSDAAVRTDGELKRIYGREYSAIISGSYGDEMRDKALRLGRYFNDPKSAFAENLKKIIEHRDQQVSFRPSEQGMWESDSFKKTRAATARFMKLLAGNGGFASTAADRKKLEELGKKLRHLDNPAATAQDILDTLGDMEGYCINTDPVKLGLPAKFFEDIGRQRPKFRLLVSEKLGLYRRLREQSYSVMMELVTAAVPYVTQSLRSRGELSFYDCLIYLRDMLREDARQGGELIRHIYSRRSRYLIDEFQDTDPLQAQIFFYITARQPRENWMECEPEPGSLFIVGDPKQSIYRFKSADVASYMLVKGLFKKGIGEVLTLSRNYRSERGLCRSFNTLFSSLMPRDTEDQCAFPMIPLTGSRDHGGSLGGLYSYITAGFKNRNLPSDKQRLPELILHLVKNKATIFDGKTVRPVDYGDIMVITPNRYALSDIMGEMEKRGIPMMVEGRTAFHQCPALVTAAAVMGAAAFPFDPAKVYRALSSSAFGLTDRELIPLRDPKADIDLKLRDDNKRLERIRELSPRAAEAMESLRELSGLADTASPAQLLSGIIDRFRLMELTGSRNLQYLVFALELIRKEAEECRIVSCAQGSEYLDGLLEEDNQEERCAALRRTPNAVHIANLHKVKGLEKPVVILAGPYRKIYPPSSRCVNDVKGSRYYLFESRTISTAQYPEEYEREKVSGAAERDRLLYVAATRAKCALIISDARNTSGETQETEPWLPLLRLPHKVIDPSPDEKGRTETTVSGKELYDNAQGRLLQEKKQLHEPSYESRIPSKLKLNKVKREEATLEEEERRKLPKGVAARIGTLIHRMMEVLVSSRGRADITAVIEEILSDNGITEEVYRESLETVAQRMMNGGYPQSNGLPADLMGELRGAGQVLCELPFCRKEGKVIWHGLIDLAYLKDGEWHIVDYKTNADGTDLDRVYAGQLKAYREAFKALTGEDAKAGIYHLDI